MIDPHLEGKVVLITGANHGIGAATALAFAKEGAKIFISYFRVTNKERNGTIEYKINQAKNADEVVTKIKSFGGNAESLEIDLSNPSNIPTLFNEAEKLIGPVDVLVNNAAYCVPDTFEINKNSIEESTSLMSSSFSSLSHDAHFAVNSRAVALMMKEYF
ncbi:SDR family NAD(P)-dependent oxidoreductase [Candidatus Roizmanbacteria bacterium]|nr:SDR family NAD(P)-dependent oxidoreductase [Candidatus Roizmanbacteria bacterium]